MHIHYIYRVRAINSAGRSAWTAEVGGDTGSSSRASLGWEGHRLRRHAARQRSAAVAAHHRQRGHRDAGDPRRDAGRGERGGVRVHGRYPEHRPGKTGTITLRFTAAALGVRRAQLLITSNAVNSPNPVWLKGTGTAPLLPGLGISPGSLSFGRQTLGSSQGAQAITLQNTGRAALRIGSIRIEGADAGDFSLANDGCSGGRLAPGIVCTLNIRFTPTAAGSRSAVLVIESGAGTARTPSP